MTLRYRYYRRSRSMVNVNHDIAAASKGELVLVTEIDECAPPTPGWAKISIGSHRAATATTSSSSSSPPPAERNMGTGACVYNRPCAHQYVGKSQSCMVLTGRLHSRASYWHGQRGVRAGLTCAVSRANLPASGRVTCCASHAMPSCYASVQCIPHRLSSRQRFAIAVWDIRGNLIGHARIKYVCKSQPCMVIITGRFICHAS